MIRTDAIHPQRVSWHSSQAGVGDYPLRGDAHPADPPPALKLQRLHAAAVVTLIGHTPLVPLSYVTESLSSAVALYVELEGSTQAGQSKTGQRSSLSGRRCGAVRCARRVVHEMVEAEPERYFHADQYSNPADPLAHYCTTGPEIWQQTEGQITHFVAGMGTSGTMMGAGRYLRERHRGVQLIGVQPDTAAHSIHGLKYLAADDVPAIYSPDMVNGIVEVTTEQSQAMARRLARQEGLFVGISAGAAVVAALQIAQELVRGVVVALLPDGGLKYASAPFWAE